MSSYSIQVAWSGKDALADSDPNKVISGSDFNDEFTAAQSKADISSSVVTFTPTASAGDNSTKVATTAFTTAAIATSIAGRTNGLGLRTVSTSAASGGSNGDIWYQVT